MTVDESLEGMHRRIREFCDEFEVEPPKLEYDPADGGVLLTNELRDWHRRHHASFDWICCGDPRPMMRVFKITQETIAEHQAAGDPKWQFEDT